LKLPNLCQRPLTVEETLPNWITERQRQTGFGTFLYIGTSECLYTRWESHHKKKAIRHLFNNGVVVHFYFYAMLPSHNHFQEDKIERANRCELEKRLIYYLCPILGDPKRWGGLPKIEFIFFHCLKYSQAKTHSCFAGSKNTTSMQAGYSQLN
jgi:hypothetical protein